MQKFLLLAACAATLAQAEVVSVKPVKERTFSQSQYVPDISLILDTSYAARSRNQDELAGLMMPGVSEDYYGQAEDDGHGHSHAAYSSDNGFNLNYAELILSANVDPNFSLDAIFHFDANDVAIEEAYFTNTTAAEGLRIRGGKMLSEFGRLNKQHPHFWDFNEMPLVYQGFLGNEGLNELGLQFQYTLPTSTYVMVGAELLQGNNEKSFGYEGVNFDHNVSGTMEPYELQSGSTPSLVVGYLKSSFDIGETSVMPGVSYAYGKSISSHDHEGHIVSFDGETSIINAELTLKHYFDSYSFLTWQSEWMYLEKKGDEYHVEADNNNTLAQHNQTVKQAGYYSQLVYAYNQNIRFGARYDSIYKNDYAFSEESLPNTPYKAYTAMAEYHFSEFSRLRLEYIHNEALYQEGAAGFEAATVDTLMLSLNLSIGAHGAHDF